MAAASTTSRNTWWRREFLPEHLTWFKWESYFTWLSGFLLLVVVYYFGADLFLIDRNVLDIASWQAILISLGSIVLGWVLYDTLCKSPIGNSTTGLMLVLFAILVGDELGLYAGVHRPRRHAAHGRVHRHDHGRQCLR